jgi:hypothetical protein
MPIFTLDVAMLFFLEIIEANLQKGDNFDSLVRNLSEFNRKSQIGFLFLNSSALFVAFYAIYYDIFNSFILVILALKCADTYTKIYLIRLAKNNDQFSASEFFGAPNVKITPAIRYAGAFLYPALFYCAIS